VNFSEFLFFIFFNYYQNEKETTLRVSFRKKIIWYIYMEIAKSIRHNVQYYIFTVCNQNKNTIQRIITKNLQIPSLPISLFNSKNGECYRTLYFQDFEILFIFIKECTLESLYYAFGMLGKKVAHYEGNILLYIDQKKQNFIRNQIISFGLGMHTPDLYKTSEKKAPHIYLYTPSLKMRDVMKDAIYQVKIQNDIRDYNNMPGNLLNSKTFEKKISQTKEKNLKIKVYQEKELKKIGLHLILGVNQGSQYPAKLIQLEFKNGQGKPIIFVGKGVTFDTGGYNLKTGDFHDMKTDMTGSSTVFGLMNLIAHHKCKGHFIGLLPIVENMIGSKAVRPGDIVTAYNKKTVEITDTDAEGRLIMADTLAYSEKFKPEMVIDVSTLTGANQYFFGGYGSSIMGNSNAYIQKMIQCGKENNEKIWEIPMWKEYQEATRSTIADYRNHSKEMKAGTIMAGAFLSNFIPPNVKWIHIDIAGNDYHSNETNTRFSGSNGVMLNTLFCFVNHLT